MPAQAGWDAINYATAAALEETLLCLPERADALTMLKARFPQAVGEYKQQLQ